MWLTGSVAMWAAGDLGGNRKRSRARKILALCLPTVVVTAKTLGT